MMGVLEVTMNVAAPARLPTPRDQTWTIAVILGLVIVTALAIVPLTLTILQSRKADALVIDMAGRQRMLLERYMKELLLASQGVPAQHEQTRALIGERLSALIDGGSTPTQIGRTEVVSLPAASTDEIRLKLVEQQRLLDRFTNQAEVFLRTSRDADAYGMLRDQLLKDNALLLDRANEAVALMTRHSESRIRGLMRWELVVVVLVVLVGAVGTWRFANQQKALEHSQAATLDALRQSDAIKSALLSSVSHELRTPLTAIKSMLFSLRDNIHDDSSRQEFLASIDEQVDYLNRLVGNLLDMSRLEAGTLKPNREWHVFDELVEGAIRRVDVLLGDRPLHVHLAPDLPPVLVDGVQIQQVLVNLLDNAVKFSPPGSPIRITASMADKALEVCVSNSGAGVPADQLDRIFERFYRLRSGGSSVPGTGLGLAICKSIIESHGGQIMAQSVPGGNTTLSFRLPFTTPTTTETESAPAQPAQRAS